MSNRQLFNEGEHDMKNYQAELRLITTEASFHVGRNKAWSYRKTFVHETSDIAFICTCKNTRTNMKTRL